MRLRKDTAEHLPQEEGGLSIHAQKDESLAVTIGQENKYNDIKDCSIISATYHLDGKPIATLAVLGPTRMDYGKIISLLKFMNANLADIFHRFHL